MGTATITDVSRCAGTSHVHVTINRSSGGTLIKTYRIDELIAAAPLSDEDYQRERMKLLVREAQSAGNTTYAQIRTFLLNRTFVE